MDFKNFSERFIYNLYLKKTGYRKDTEGDYDFEAASSYSYVPLKSFLFKKIINNTDLFSQMLDDYFAKPFNNTNYGKNEYIFTDIQYTLDFDKDRDSLNLFKQRLWEYASRNPSKLGNVFNEMNYLRDENLTTDNIENTSAIVNNIKNNIINNFNKQINDNTITTDTIDQILQIDPTLGNSANGLLLGQALKNNPEKKDLYDYWLEKFTNKVLEENRMQLSNLNDDNYVEGVANDIETAIKQLIRSATNDKVDIKSFSNLLRTQHRYSCTYLLSFARCGDEDLLSFMTPSQIRNINIKNFNELLNQAAIAFPDNDISNFQSVVKGMYLSLGKQKTLDILNKKYGEILFTKLENMFNAVDTKNIVIPERNSEPFFDERHQKLLNFLFASGVADVNATIKKIISGELNRDKISFPRLINEWDIIYETLGEGITIDKIIKTMNDVSLVLAPDEMEIEQTVKFAGISKDVFEKIRKTNAEMQKRKVSTIPKIEGQKNNFDFEMLDLDDPNQMNVGYITDCCFTFNGASESSLIHGCTSENGRIFVVKKDGVIIAQSWVWRNGTTICFDNIETVGSPGKNNSIIYDFYQEAAKQLITISAQNEQVDQRVNLVTVGKEFTKISLEGKKLRVDNLPSPLEKGVYTDAKTKGQVILACDDTFKEDNIKRGHVDPIYKDARKLIKTTDMKAATDDQIKKSSQILNKINYKLIENKKSFVPINIEETYSFITYGSDWYIGIKKNGETDYKCLTDDPIAKDEMMANLEKIKAIMNNTGDSYNDNVEIASTGGMKRG